MVDLTGVRYRACEQLSQRKLPALATIQVTISDGMLRIGADGMPSVCEVPIDEAKYLDNDEVVVQCGAKSTTSAGSWQLGTMVGRSANADVNQWLSQHLNASDESKQNKPEAQYALE